MRKDKSSIKIINKKQRIKVLFKFKKILFKTIFIISLFILFFYISNKKKCANNINNIFNYIKTYDGYFPYIETQNYFIYNNLNNYNIVGALKIKSKYKNKLKNKAINPDKLYGNITNEHTKGISYGYIITKVKEFNNNTFILLALQKNENLIIKSEYEYTVNLYYKDNEVHIPLYNKNEKGFGYHYCNHKLDLNKTEIYYYNLSKDIIDNKEYYILHKSLKSKLFKFILKTEDNNLYNSKDNIIIKNEIIGYYTKKKLNLSKYSIYIESQSILGIFIVYLNVFILGKYKLYIIINDKINITTNIIIREPKAYYISNNKEIDILNNYDGHYPIKGMQEYEGSFFDYKIIFFDLLDENKFKIISYDKQYEITYINNINYITNYFNISIQIECINNSNNIITYFKLDEINFRFVFNEENEHFSIINQMQQNGEFNIKIKTIKNFYTYNYNLIKYSEKNKINPLITIIVPNYNCKNYIDKTIKSILEQTISNYEVIFVDDMSTDGSDNEIEKYVKKDKRFKLFRTKKKLGAPGARNLGLDNMNGKWLKFLDSDDILPKNCLERCINLAFDKNVSNVYFNMEIKRHNSKYQSFYYNTDNLDIVMGNINNKFFLFSPIKKHILRQITFSNTQSDSGIEFSLEYLLIIYRQYYTNEVLYKVIIRPNSNSRNKNTRISFLARNQKIYKYKAYLQKKYNLKFGANLRNIYSNHYTT